MWGGVRLQADQAVSSMWTVCGAESAQVWDFADRFPSLNLGGDEHHPVPLAHLSSSHHTLSPWAVSLSRLTPGGGGVWAALGAVVFGHVVGHPVDFGGPALSQGLVELLAELLQRLVVRFAQRQRVLRREEVRG